jgi:hypothetical protein
MDANDPEEPASSTVERAIPETGPYVLRGLLEDLPLSADGSRDDIDITCVEFLGMQLALLNLAFSGSLEIEGRIRSHPTANSFQISTSTLEPPRPRSSIFYKYLPILQMRPEDHHILKPRG